MGNVSFLVSRLPESGKNGARGEEGKNDNGRLVATEKGGQTAREKEPWQEGRAGAKPERNEGECRCGVESVAGGKWEDPGNDPGGWDPGRWTVSPHITVRQRAQPKIALMI